MILCFYGLAQKPKGFETQGLGQQRYFCWCSIFSSLL